MSKDALPEPPTLEERLARLQRPLGDGSYLAASWDNYYTRRYRDVCAIIKALFDTDGHAEPDRPITVLEYGCSAGALFRALDHNLGSRFHFRFIGVDTDRRASGFLRAKMPAVEIHEADLTRFEEMVAAASLTADVCVAMSQLYGTDEQTASRLLGAYAAIAPHVVVVDQIDNVNGGSGKLLELVDHSERRYEAFCHPFARLLSDAGYRAIASFPAAEPYKSISGYVVASRADGLSSDAIAASLQRSDAAGDGALAQPVSFGAILSDFLRANKLACMDVGAAGGVHDLWRPYSEFIEVDAFEPNEEACRRAAAASQPFVHWHPVALGAQTGAQQFYVLSAPTGSSFYPPNDDVQQFFNGSSYRRITRIVDIETLTIADFLHRFHRPMPNLIKLDTQGSELDILRSVDDSQWPAVFAIEVEVEFAELYKNQPLFCDVDGFLRSKGLVLFDLRTAREYCCAHDDVAYYLKKYFDVSTGRNDMSARLYAGDALYIRNFLTEPPTSRDDLLRLVATLLIYLYFDYAIYVCDVGLEQGLLTASEHETLIAEIVAGAPRRRPVDHVYQAFWQVRSWPNQ